MIVLLNDIPWLLYIPPCRWRDQWHRPGFGWSCDMSCHLTPNLQSCDCARIWMWGSHDFSDHDIWIAWNRVKQSVSVKNPPWTRLIFLLQFFFACGDFSDNVTDLYSESLNVLISVLCLNFCSICYLTWSSLFFWSFPWSQTEHLWTSHLLGWRPLRKLPLWATVWTLDSQWLLRMQWFSNHSMNDGLILIPWNDVVWGILGLRKWSWANILISVPSLRWGSYFNLLSFPDDDVIVVFVSVFDVIILLSSCVQQITFLRPALLPCRNDACERPGNDSDPNKT